MQKEGRRMWRKPLESIHHYCLIQLAHDNRVGHTLQSSRGRSGTRGSYARDMAAPARKGGGPAGQGRRVLLLRRGATLDEHSFVALPCLLFLARKPRASSPMDVVQRHTHEPGTHDLDAAPSPECDAQILQARHAEVEALGRDNLPSVGVNLEEPVLQPVGLGRVEQRGQRKTVAIPLQSEERLKRRAA